MTLDHWCQHTHLKIEFPDTALIRISGPNNVGKSNLIKAIGRVLAQGRSDFGDAGDIQYGAKQAEIRLEAETCEGAPFSMERTIREKQSKVSLRFKEADRPLTAADEVEAKLAEWFGRQDTLLSLFIAPQGRISSLLKTGGKQRLVDFIEICGFKSFLQKQQGLNKFIRAYPVIQDPSMTLADIQAKAQAATCQAAEKQAAIDAMPPFADVKSEAEALQAEKSLRTQQKEDLAAKKTEIQGKEELASKPLPDLKQLEKDLQSQEDASQAHRLCLQYQNLQKEQAAQAAAAAQLNSLLVDQTNYTAQIQEISDSLQKDLQSRSAFEQAEKELEGKKEELRKLQDKIGALQKLAKEMKYSKAWHVHSIGELQKGLTLLAQRNAQSDALSAAERKLQALLAVPPPTPDILKACQASEGKLQELLHLQEHARGARNICPLCKSAWAQPAIAARVRELEAEIQDNRGQIAESQGAQKAYQAWLQAQKGAATAQEEIDRARATLNEIQTRIERQIQSWAVPASELDFLSAIIVEYAQVHEALNPPEAAAKAAEEEVGQLQSAVNGRVEEKKGIQARIESANQRMREVLGKQTKAQEANTQRAKLQQKVETLLANVAALRAEISQSPPSEFDPARDYGAIVSQDEKKTGDLRREFGKASTEWANRSEQGKEIAALRREISKLENVLTTDAWSEAKEARLVRSSGQLLIHQRISAEVAYIHGQIQQLKKQLEGLHKQKAAFDAQTLHLANLQAVSAFLSYDNGPQKFLQEFFRGTLHQTNLLVSEMGLPVTLQMGDALEIMVQDSQQRISSSLALGGGYANLIGIAFRIALQKMVLPRVNTVILDEPSTHVDEQNMELLIPFFEKLKESLHTYGISQCIIIDHHPAWRNSSVGIINIGNNGENGESSSLPK